VSCATRATGLHGSNETERALTGLQDLHRTRPGVSWITIGSRLGLATSRYRCVVSSLEGEIAEVSHHGTLIASGDQAQIRAADARAAAEASEFAVVRARAHSARGRDTPRVHQDSPKERHVDACILRPLNAQILSSMGDGPPPTSPVDPRSRGRGRLLKWPSVRGLRRRRLLYSAIPPAPAPIVNAAVISTCRRSRVIPRPPRCPHRPAPSTNAARDESRGLRPRGSTKSGSNATPG